MDPSWVLDNPRITWIRENLNWIWVKKPGSPHWGNHMNTMDDEDPVPGYTLITLYVGRVPQWSAPHSGQTLVEYLGGLPRQQHGNLGG